jgi:hypothetical protein
MSETPELLEGPSSTAAILPKSVGLCMMKYQRAAVEAQRNGAMPPCGVHGFKPQGHFVRRVRCLRRV